MTTQEAVDLFLVLQDKYGSPSVESDEVVDLLNMATHAWLSDMVPSNLGGVVNYELDSNVLSNIAPLIFAITGNMNGSGVLTNAAITSALVTAGAEAGATWFRVGNVAITTSGVTYPVKFTKHNNWWAYARNAFKKGTATRPRFTLRQDGLLFSPVNASDTLSLVIVKKPKTLALSPAVNPELSDTNMYNIIAKALKLAGVATRDEELITLDARNSVQLTK